MKINFSKIAVWLFFGLICTLSVSTLLFPNKDFIQKENGYSQNERKNPFSVQAENYLKQTFFQKKLFVTAKNYIKLFSGKQQFQDTLVLNDALIQIPTDENKTAQGQNVLEINYLSSKINTVVALVPSAFDIYAEQIPKYIMKSSQKKQVESVYRQLDKEILTVDLFTPMINEKEQLLFYKNDNRLTSFGSFLCYSSISKYLDLQPIPIEKWDIEKTLPKYYGTLYQSTLLHLNDGDTIDIYTYQNSNKIISVEKSNGGKILKSSQIFDKANLLKEDKYGVFLGEQSPFIKIKTNQQNQRKIIIFKNSNVNSMVQFLTAHYSEILLVDINLTKDFSKIDFRDYEKALVMVNANEFLTNNLFSSNLT